MTVILLAVGMKMWMKRDERWFPSCRHDAITGHLILTIRRHCPPTTKTLVELIFDSSDSANNFNLIMGHVWLDVILNLAPSLEMHFSSRGLSDFSNSLLREGSWISRQSSRRGNFSRLLFTIDRYVASDYQVLYNLVLHLVPSDGYLRDRVVGFTTPGQRHPPDRYFICDVWSFAAINHFPSYEFFAKVLFGSCISTMYVCIINNCDRVSMW